MSKSLPSRVVTLDVLSSGFHWAFIIEPFEEFTNFTFVVSAVNRLNDLAGDGKLEIVREKEDSVPS